MDDPNVGRPRLTGDALHDAAHRWLSIKLRVELAVGRPLTDIQVEHYVLSLTLAAKANGLKVEFSLPKPITPQLNASLLEKTKLPDAAKLFGPGRRVTLKTQKRYQRKSRASKQQGQGEYHGS